eukprot:9430083-Karenia_brevis.AAC.1
MAKSLGESVQHSIDKRTQSFMTKDSFLDLLAQNVDTRIQANLAPLLAQNGEKQKREFEDLLSIRHQQMQ